MKEIRDIEAKHFTEFTKDVSEISLPDTFTFPFYYEPHPLAVIAAEELQAYLHQQKELDHNFGLEADSEGMVLGKMFGVLVVQNKEGRLGFLSAFSGKLANSNHHDKFVPPVFDTLIETGVFLTESEQLNKINRRLEVLENGEDYLELKSIYAQFQDRAERELSLERKALKEGKDSRKMRRESQRNVISSVDFEVLQEELKQESLKEQYYYKMFAKSWDRRLGQIKSELDVYQNEIDRLKAERKARSSETQRYLFEQYNFLNQEGKEKNIQEIFAEVGLQLPPAGAGECAAPKLLQYAFLNGLTPVVMAEFWWGQSPKSEVRKHQQYYPACRGKCEPILKHMLDGMKVDENPMLSAPVLKRELEILMEDEVMLVINKPDDFLSVPGITISASIYEEMKKRYPDASGPLIVHRLDMSTSGIMLIAKNMDVYRDLQRQFISRTIKKRYVALLDGTLSANKGTIELPLRVDLDDRPRQLVCFEHGKPAKTFWQVVSRKDNKTRVHFYPITGRTHQLRVHAAHPSGLNMPILGDDLYGTKKDRLYLHADFIEFTHPISSEIIRIKCPAAF